MMTASETVLKTLDRDGYAMLPGLLSPAECAAIRAEVERWLVATPTGRNSFEGYKTQRVYNLVGKSRAFDPLIEHPLVFSAMWAIDDFTEVNGATRVIAGSHRWADERPDAATPAAPVEMPRGSLLVYVGTLWHGG